MKKSANQRHFLHLLFLKENVALDMQREKAVWCEFEIES